MAAARMTPELRKRLAQFQKDPKAQQEIIEDAVAQHKEDEEHDSQDHFAQRGPWDHDQLV